MRGVAAAVVVLLLGATAAAGAVTISSYDVRIVAEQSGPSRGAATIVLNGAGPGTVAVPLGFEAASVKLTAAPPGTQLFTERINGQTRLRFAMRGDVPAKARLDFVFFVPEVFTIPEPPAGQKSVLPRGSRMLNHRFVNTEAATIERYRMEAQLPADARAHSIVEALPRPGSREADPRVQIVSSGAAAALSLRVAGLRQGDVTSMQVEVVPRSRSLLWLAAGILLSALYLIYFRDLVVPARRDAAGSPQPGD